MRLITEILHELGSDGLSTARVQYTVVDGKGGYFQNVRRLLEFSPESILLAGKKGRVRVQGNSLSLGKCVAGDVAVRGDILKVEREE